MKYSPIKIKEELENNNFKIKKYYGQNFITDENIIDSIINKSEITKDTFVIEIGPGIGSLTNKLCLNAKCVLCYEIDTTLKDILSNNLKDYKNVEVIYNDFLKSNIKKDIEKYSYKNMYVVANLPYYITTPIIIKIIESKLNVDKIVVMVQKEVGNRFKAKPNTKDYGSLSVYLNYYYDVRKIMDVSKNIFIPKPNVDSIVVEFTKKEKKEVNESIFFKLVKDSFKQKRKTLKNNLVNYDLNKIDEVLKKYNLSINNRAEQIPVDVYIDIANNLTD